MATLLASARKSKELNSLPHLTGMGAKKHSSLPDIPLLVLFHFPSIPAQYSHWCSLLHPLTDEKNEALNSSVQLVQSHIASQREELALNSGFFSFPLTKLGNIWSPPHPSYLALSTPGNLNFLVCKDKNSTPPFHDRPDDLRTQPDDLRTLATLQDQTANTKDESPAGSLVFT